jgi:DNA-binding CsgD family transcriptional regulator
MRVVLASQTAKLTDERSRETQTVNENENRSTRGRGGLSGVASEDRDARPGGRRVAGAPLSTREREILGLLAGGVSGAQIAESLVLSPETVRTHIRNAMAKLGASSRAQAVALAVKRQEIEPHAELADGQPHAAPAPVPAAGSARARARAALAAGESDAILAALLGGLVSLYDVEGGMIFLADEDGLGMRRAAVMGEEDEPDGPQAPERIAVGEGALGRAALERRAQLVHSSGSQGADLGRTSICAPMVAAGKLVGVIYLTTRPSRLTGRTELLLLQAFSNRVGEILVGGSSDEGPLRESLQRFRTAWSAASGSA